MIKTITYENKEAIQNNATIPNKNKVTASDMNEIKSAVNENAQELQQAQNSLSTLETDNNTNKTNIEDLQADNEAYEEDIANIKLKNIEQDTEIEELTSECERLRNDINSISITEEAEGEDITLTETSDARFKKFEAAGNSYQETREGYNLFQVTATSVTKSGVTYTVNEDGSVTASGTSTGSSLDLNTITLQPGTYTFTGGPANGGENKQRLSIYDWTNNTADVLYFLYGGNKYTLTVEEEMVIKLTYVVQNGITVSNETIYPQIVQGSEEKPFEPYGAKPSFEYPSEIQTVNDNINFAVCNKNFFKITSTTKTVTKNGVTITIDDDGLITINGTCTADWWPDLTYDIANNSIVHDEPKYYTPKASNFVFSSKYIGGSVSPNVYVTAWYLDKKAEKAAALTSINESVSKSFATSINAITRAYLTINNGRVFNNYKFYLQLEEGTTATDYIEPNEQSFTIPVQQEMLTGDGFVKIDGVWKELHNWTTITENGSTNTMEVAGTGTTGKYRYTITSSVSIKDCATDANLAYCDKFKLIKATTTHGCVRGFTTSQNEIWIYDEGESLADFKAKIADNPITFKVQLVTATHLDCTEEQKAILDEIEKTIHTYKEKTHVYSADELSPVFSVEAIKDTNTVVNSILIMISANEGA